MAKDGIRIDLTDPSLLPDDPDDVDLSDQSLLLNRELSELAFQRRVLHEAEDERNPPLERVRFLSIVTRNMDEFFMKRVGGLAQQVAAGVTERSPDGLTPGEQLDAVFAAARPVFERQATIWHDEVRPALAEAGIEVVEYDDLDDAERADLRAYFEASVLPTLTPLSVTSTTPFPFISNLSLSLGVLTRDEGDDPRFSRVKVPENRPRLVPVDGDPGAPVAGQGGRFVRLERVIAANLDLLFPNVEVLGSAPFRVTRNAEVWRYEDVAEGLIRMIEGVLRDRRFATVVRLELAADAPERIREVLIDRLDLDGPEVIARRPPLDFGDLEDLTDVDRPDLKLDAWTPRPHPRLGSCEPGTGEIFEEIRRRDVLVHHPYHSFEGTVQAFLREAAHDPDVLAVKAAIYRTSADSKVVEHLIEAARNGKQVAVMVELQARFDEAANLQWVEKLEEEGIHVAYGTPGMKTHSKVALVVRDETEGASGSDGTVSDGQAKRSPGVRTYAHVGTGNYHAGTARSYVDLGLLTADPDIGRDLMELFNYFTGHSDQDQYRKLLVAPRTLRSGMVDRIQREVEHARTGDGGRIVAVMNSLEDPGMVRELYAAAQAGVDIDLVVRGICRLRPGIEGLSDRIRVRSIVGRFLEHSRIFYFGNSGDPEYFVGSADWMTRNLDRRVEAVVPVEDPDHRTYLDQVLSLLLAEDRKAWVMDEDGGYEQLRPDDGDVAGRNLHETLMAMASDATTGKAVGSDLESITWED